MYTQSHAVFISFNTTGRIDQIHQSFIVTSPSGTCNIYGMQPNYQLRCNDITNPRTQVSMNAGVFTSENGKTNERIVFTVVRSTEPLTVSFRMSSMSPPFIVLYTFSVDVILTGEELMQFITVNNGIVTDVAHYGSQGRFTVCPQHSGDVMVTLRKCRCVKSS